MRQYSCTCRFFTPDFSHPIFHLSDMSENYLYRVHPSAGEPVLCLFDNERKDEVLEDILQYVRIVGEAKEEPISGKITSIKIHDIERLEEIENEAVDLLPKGSPISRDFWESLTIDELAE